MGGEKLNAGVEQIIIAPLPGSIWIQIQSGLPLNCVGVDCMTRKLCLFWKLTLSVVARVLPGIQEGQAEKPSRVCTDFRQEKEKARYPVLLPPPEPWLGRVLPAA